MLTKAQIEEYNDVGAIVVRDVLTPAEVRTLSDVTDGFVDRARGLTGHTVSLVNGSESGTSIRERIVNKTN